jgi:3-mercaptopyruvate sulfurtransferase SseA
MKTGRYRRISVWAFFVLVTLWGLSVQHHAAAEQKISIYQATLEELNQKTPEISTEELNKLLAAGANPAPVIDCRPAAEYAIAHIPGSINIAEKEADHITKAYPDKSTLMVLYCNGVY